MGNGHHRFMLAAPAGNAVILRVEVAAFRPGDAPGDLAEHAAQPDIALGRLPAQPLAAALLVTGARYIGRAKTLCQLLLAATVANLTLVATQVGLMRGHRRRQAPGNSRVFAPIVLLFAICRLPAVYASAPRPRTCRPSAGFRPHSSSTTRELMSYT